MISLSDFGTWARLGNQMFQWAYLRSVSLENNYNIKLPSLKSPFGYSEPQLFSAFDLNVDIITKEDKFDYKIKETCMNFNKSILYDKIPKNKNILFSGYFQSEQYFKKIL